ncbi:MAG: YdcH family protein [Polyangiales bacterium]
MPKTSRSVTERARLEQKHAQLSAKVTELDAKRALTASEEFELAQLKKAKLQMKDALNQLAED